METKETKLSDIAYALTAIFTSGRDNELGIEHHQEIQRIFRKITETLSEEELKTLLYVNPELVDQAIEEKHMVDKIFNK